MSEYTEKRQAERLAFEAPVTLNVVGSQENIAGHCVNMSSTGILIGIEKPVDVDANLDINLQAETKDVFFASGQVVRLIEDGERFLAAIRFEPKTPH